MIYEFAIVSLHAFLGWIFSLIFFFYAKDKYPQNAFLFMYYLVRIMVFAVVYLTFYKFWAKDIHPFTVTAFTLIFMSTIDFIVFKYLFKGTLDFLNFSEFILPYFITLTVIYFMGILLK